eukprot:scaffold935_cov155-Amphora_coffeaeformis.AAC.19
MVWYHTIPVLIAVYFRSGHKAASAVITSHRVYIVRRDNEGPEEGWREDKSAPTCFRNTVAPLGS